jgi:hypothetical protein
MSLDLIDQFADEISFLAAIGVDNRPIDYLTFRNHDYVTLIHAAIRKHFAPYLTSDLPSFDRINENENLLERTRIVAQSRGHEELNVLR